MRKIKHYTGIVIKKGDPPSFAICFADHGGSPDIHFQNQPPPILSAAFSVCLLWNLLLFYQSASSGDLLLLFLSASSGDLLLLFLSISLRDLLRLF